MNNEQNVKWYLSIRFWLGLIIGGVLVTFVGFLPSIILLVQYNLEPNAIEDCKYGLTTTFYGQFCTRESELDVIGGTTREIWESNMCNYCRGLD